jgi:hypothetical protein
MTTNAEIDRINEEIANAPIEDWREINGTFYHKSQLEEEEQEEEEEEEDTCYYNKYKCNKCHYVTWNDNPDCSWCPARHCMMCVQKTMKEHEADELAAEAAEEEEKKWIEKYSINERNEDERAAAYEVLERIKERFPDKVVFGHPDRMLPREDIDFSELGDKVSMWYRQQIQEQWLRVYQHEDVMKDIIETVPLCYTYDYVNCHNCGKEIVRGSEDHGWLTADETGENYYCRDCRQYNTRWIWRQKPVRR